MSESDNITQNDMEFVDFNRFAFMSYCIHSLKIRHCYTTCKKTMFGIIIKFCDLNICKIFLEWLETHYGIAKEYKSKPNNYNNEKYSVELSKQDIERMKFIKAIY